MTRLKEMALDLLFPRWCVGCGGEGSFLCESCLRSLPRIEPPVCSKCGRPYTGGHLCPDCLDWASAIDGIRSPFRFEGAIREAVHQLKYRNLRAIVPDLAELLYIYLQRNSLPVEVLVPVPLHRKRLRERGYNQSLLLAESLGKLIGMPVWVDCLYRQKNNPPQARTATLRERQNNIKDAFTCRNSRVRGARILLIDDVATSGATLDACTAALKASGAESVWALVLAREV